MGRLRSYAVFGITPRPGAARRYAAGTGNENFTVHLERSPQWMVHITVGDICSVMKSRPLGACPPAGLLGPSACDQLLLRNPSFASQGQFRCDRRFGLLAIGQCLKDQYDAFATPIPPHLAALVKQLETQK
jgi:hypothetical protein